MTRTLARRAGALTLAAILAAGPAPAFADVKAGVDAWARGDYATAVREWAEPAANGDPDAQFNMAQAYRLGRGVETDPRQAEALYRAAAAKGHLKAADNYGLMLFQDGRRQEAMPYVLDAAERGDPRAQYLVGVAHFNGDLVEKDWVRAYALLTLANGTGLPQARSAIAQMDQYIPLEQREEAQALAQTIKAESNAQRARQLASLDLERGPQATVTPRIAGESERRDAEPAPAPAPPPVEVEENAGADFTLAPTAAEVAAAVAPAVAPAEAESPPAAAPAPESRPAPVSGPWKVQLGAFGKPGNAERLMQSMADDPSLSGARLVGEPAGRLTKVLAVGFASQADAGRACAALKRNGQDCLVTR